MHPDRKLRLRDSRTEGPEPRFPGLTGSFPFPHRFTDTPVCPLFLSKVKIWFQNKRSKYKKLLKQSSGELEEDFSGRPPSLSPHSLTLPSIWDLPKAGTLPTSGYDNSFGTWYQHHSPDVLALPQRM